LSLPDFAFCSFTLWILHHFLFFAEPLVCVFHVLSFLVAFKMGVKTFRTATIFWISPRCLLLLHHDTFVFHRRFILGVSRSFNFHRDAIVSAPAAR
jgi:hypothetical protein